VPFKQDPEFDSLERALAPVQPEMGVSPANEEECWPRSEVRKALDTQLLGATGMALHREDAPGLHVNWHYSQAPKLLWSEGQPLTLSVFGCVDGSLESRVRCFFSTVPDLYGMSDPDAELDLLASTELRDGRVKLRFGQLRGGYPVLGAHIIVTVDPSGEAITRIVSFFVRDLEFCGQFSLLSLPSLVEPDGWRSAAESSIDEFIVEWSSPFLGLHVDQLAMSQVALPVFVSVGYTEEHSGYLVLVNIDGTVHSIDKLQRNAATVAVKTWTAYRDYAGANCSTDANCGRPPWICHQDAYLANCDKCALACTQNSHCSGTYGADWKCFTSVDDDFYKYCWLDSTSDEETIYQNGYLDADYTCHHKFKYAVDSWLDWNTFLYSALGRSSWDDADGSLTLKLKKGCISPGCPSNSGGYGSVYMNDWYSFTTGGGDEAVANRYHIIGHEGGHSVHQSIAGGFPSHNDCVCESMAQLMGGMFARDKLSSAHWYTSGYRVSPWYDQTCGLSACAHGGFGPSSNIGYSQRSRYDWMPCTDETQVWSGTACTDATDCPPYYQCRENPSTEELECTLEPSRYYNRSIWLRFARVLAEGPDTFDDDGNNENIGVTFTAVGLPTAIDIIYDAKLDLTTGSDQYDFADSLAAAGWDAGKLGEVQMALGAVGYRGLHSATPGGYTNEAPRAGTFMDWGGSSIRSFYALKDESSYDLKVVYHNGTSWVTRTISANTEDTAALAIFNNRLHVFWRDRSNDRIKFQYVNPTGTWYGTYDIGASPLGITSKGAFDAVVFNGYLYLVFTKSGSHYIQIAKCSTSPYGCTTSTWHEFSANTYHRSVSWYGMPGLAAAAGAGINGTTNLNTEYMYIVSAYPTGGFYKHIRVLRMNAADSISNTDYRWLPGTHPSYKADYWSVMGAEIRSSAFSDGNKYLYIVWNDEGSNELYTSIMQDFNESGADVNGAWFTRSMKLGRQSYKGATFWEFDSSYSARHVYTSTANVARYNVIFAYY
jgi:hypothetical protein